MQFAISINVKRALKLALVSAGAFLFLSPSIVASASIEPIAQSVEIAQADDPCPVNTYMLRYGQTRNYYVWICSTEGGTLYYVGEGKDGRRGSITLRIGRYTGERFVANNGITRYTLTPSQLVVTQRGRTILSERVTQWWERGS